ncbi:MAG: DNA mismatch repair endonuclease MutL [Thermoplasmata archaeon]|jgi:DNA mismatch repair protein MutL
MNRIRLLDERTASLIAAGEVVERPANVVKELVENSIDAGASRIQIDIKGGGKREITVTDDGIGMGEEDAILSVMKHSTSKISSIDDLMKLSTLGFRGEALFSISSVSRMELWTGESLEVPSTYIYLEGGKIVKKEKREPRKGTLVSVRDLFYNLPARKKSLRSDNSEFLRILDMVKIFELSREDIHFIFRNEGRIVHDLPPVGNLRDRFAQLYSPGDSLQMLQLDANDGAVKVKGITSRPSLTRKTSDHIFIFVNSRYVEYDEVKEAILEGYGSKIFHGLFPITVLRIEIPPDMVDVNIHPQKLRVKFIDEKRVLKAVREAVSIALSGVNIIPSEKPGKSGVLERMDTLLEEEKPFFNVEPGIRQKRIEEHIPDLGGIRIIGQLFNTYILCETPSALLIVDQHAAHERVRTEKFLNEIKEKRFQELITPLIMELPSPDIEVLRENVKILEDMGFIMDIYQRSIAIRRIPSMFKRDEIKDIIMEAIDYIRSTGGTRVDEEKRYEIISTMACKGAIKANMKLTEGEMKDIIYHLMRCDNPYTCPHGRPTMISIELKELEKMFKRRP